MIRNHPFLDGNKRIGFAAVILFLELNGKRFTAPEAEATLKTLALVVVFMPHDVHVVCYIAESHCYLDYNRRKQASPLVKCEGDLSALATSVAQSFRSPWRSVSEFTFRDGGRHFVSTIFR